MLLLIGCLFDRMMVDLLIANPIAACFPWIDCLFVCLFDVCVVVCVCKTQAVACCPEWPFVDGLARVVECVNDEEKGGISRRGWLAYWR